MKYRLGDICSISKGATGIMKAIPGPYTMIALGEADKTHNEFQFDAKAVIIPLVSSTGHGHASMKRVKYCEGKFALGNILCAVIPNDENFVLAKYLHIYLHWNREELLVSQMKGMANVSLPMNRIADVMVTMPSIDKQREIIELEKQLVEKEIEADSLFADQLTLLENLNQAILQEAVQGKLVQQDPKDEPASELLKRIKAEKAKSGKKEKPLPPIKPEEIPFEIPSNWVWCRLGEIIEYTDNLDIQKHLSPDTIINYVDIDAIDNHNFVIREAKQKTVRELSTRARRVLKPNFIAYSTVRPYLKNIAVIEDDLENYIGSTGFNVFKTLNVELKYAFYYLLTPYVNNSFKDLMVGFNSPSITNDQFEKSLSPLPPLSEQKRIVAEIEKQLAKTKQLKEHIIANQQATEQLLKALLHQAFEVEEMEEVNS
jgi:type I restriction enzyme S subunit